MTYLKQWKILLLVNIILAMSEGNLVEAYEILVREAITRSLSFGLSYGATRCAETVGEYLLGPVADLPIVGDYILTSPADEVLERGSKLVAGGVSVISTATSDYIPPGYGCRGSRSGRW